MRIAGIIFGAVLVLLVAAGAYIYIQAHALETEQVSEDLYVIYGMGGNVGVLRTGEGAVVVDTMTLASQGERILEKAKELTGEDVVMIINSHYHLDHTHGNPGFPVGTRVLSTERTLRHLEQTDQDYFADTPELLPNETFEESMRVSLGNKNLFLLHPGRGHTDGDLVVWFEEEKVIHMGDLFFNKLYPNIDLEGGGSVQDWPGSIDKVFEALEFERVIPGHGQLSGADDLRQFQSFLRQLGEIGMSAKETGKTLEDTIASDELTEDAVYEKTTMLGLPIGLDRSFVLQRSWEEAQGAFILRE